MNTKRILKTALIIAVVSSPLIAVLADRFPYLIAAPILVGVSIVVVCEFRESLTSR